MSTVAEVESALRKMPVQDARAIALWLQNYLNASTPLSAVPQPLPPEQLEKCYGDEDWAAFENHCGKASD